MKLPNWPPTRPADSSWQQLHAQSADRVMAQRGKTFVVHFLIGICQSEPRSGLKAQGTAIPGAPLLKQDSDFDKNKRPAAVGPPQIK